MPKTIAGNGFSVTDDRPDYVLNVVVARMEDLDPDKADVLGFLCTFCSTPSNFVAEARFRLADPAGRVMSSGTVSGKSSESLEDVRDQLASAIATRMK